MSQVQRTVNQLIIQAYRLIGELGDAEPLTDTMLQDGLYCMNELLDQFSVSSVYVPFVSTINFNFTPMQDTYTFSDIVPADFVSSRFVDLSLANYQVDGEIFYPIRIIDRADYYLQTRVTNVTARPGLVWVNKQGTETAIVFYPIPDQPYLCQLQVKVMINSFAPQDSLNSIPPHYVRFLKYALSRELKAYYPSANWPTENEDEYQRTFQSLRQGLEKDVGIRPSAIMVSKEPYYWQTILAY
jgi:hypothetical protein